MISTTELPPCLPSDVIDKMLLISSKQMCFELELSTSATNKSARQCHALQRPEKKLDLSRALARIKAELEAAKAEEERQLSSRVRPSKKPKTEQLVPSTQSKQIFSIASHLPQTAQ